MATSKIVYNGEYGQKSFPEAQHWQVANTQNRCGHLACCLMAGRAWVTGPAQLQNEIDSGPNRPLEANRICLLGSQRSF
jgi:hypothetical protein